MQCMKIHNHRLCIQVWSGHIHTIRCLSEFHEVRAAKNHTFPLWRMGAEKHKSHWSIRRLLPPLAILVTYFLPFFCPFNGFHDNLITFIHIDTQPNWHCHAWYWTYHSQIIFIIHILQIYEVHRQIQSGYKLNVNVIHICHPWHVNHFQLWWACHKTYKKHNFIVWCTDYICLNLLCLAKMPRRHNLFYRSSFRLFSWFWSPRRRW